MKNLKLIGCFLASCLLVIGCQKKEAKNSPRCIYDQQVFRDAALSAVNDAKQFATFKQNPFFNLLWENDSQEEGQEWLEKIERDYPFLKDKYAVLAEMDRLGSPRVFAYGDVGEFSASTLRLAAIAGEIQQRVGSWEGKKVVQIGAEYGALCKILHAISEFESYTLVDLPEQLALAKKCIDAFGLKNVEYFTPDELPKFRKYDLVLSDKSFSEFNRRYQQLFFDRVISVSHSGFFIGRIFPKHYGVIPMSMEDLKGHFEKLGKFSSWEMQEATLVEENYKIAFTRLNII